MSSFDSMNFGRDHLSSGTSRPFAYSKWPKSSHIDARNASIPRTPAQSIPPASLHATLIQALVTKLPDFDPTWEAEVQQKWFEAWALLAEHLDQKDEDY
jgi:hypothetical protein